MVLSLKLGAFALLSTLGTFWHYAAPSTLGPQVPRQTTAIACATRYGVSGVHAARFLEELRTAKVEDAIERVVNNKNPLNKLISAIGRANVSAFEDCAGVRPGYTVVVARSKPRESAYRTFLKESMTCAGHAFRDGGEAWPSEGVALDMIEMMSVDWLSSASHLMEYASKYKPAISALASPGPENFRACMHGVRKLPGSPSQREARRRIEKTKRASQFDAVLDDVTGRSVLQGGRTQGVKAQGPVPGAPNRRLMKGYFSSFFFTFYSCDEGEDCTVEECFGNDGTVLEAGSGRKLRIGDVQVGDRLKTTVDDDEVWYVHSPGSIVQMVKLVLEDTTLDITPHHLISTSTGMRLAGEVKPGDSVWQQKVVGARVLSKVLQVQLSVGQVSAPITKSGTIVVNGMVASCYAHGTHDVLHLSFAPFRAIYSLFPSLITNFAAVAHDLVVYKLGRFVPLNQHMDVVIVASAITALSLPAVPLVLALRARRTT